jgi:hypothetical protein
LHVSNRYLYHNLGDCFKPYKALFNLQTNLLLEKLSFLLLNVSVFTRLLSVLILFISL